MYNYRESCFHPRLVSSTVGLRRCHQPLPQWLGVCFGVDLSKDHVWDGPKEDIVHVYVYIYIHIIPYIYIYIVTYGVYFVSTCLIPKWGRIRTPKPAPSRHGLEVIVLTFLLLPEQVLSSFNEDLLYIYSVWYCILYIYMYNYSFNEDLPACHGWMETTWFENTSPSKSLRKDCSFWLVWIMYLFMWFM